MKIAFTPIVILSVFVSFFFRGEALKLTRNNYGYTIADIIFVICIVVIVFTGITVLFYNGKFNAEKLFQLKLTKQKLLDLFIFSLFFIGYFFYLLQFGGEWISGRFTILLIPLPILIYVYFLELRWLKSIEFEVSRDRSQKTFHDKW